MARFYGALGGVTHGEPFLQKKRWSTIFGHSRQIISMAGSDSFRGEPAYMSVLYGTQRQPGNCASAALKPELAIDPTSSAQFCSQTLAGPPSEDVHESERIGEV